MLSRLLAKIPGHLPRAWVMGILLWCVALALMVSGTIFGVLHWHAALMTVLALMFLVFLGFMGCIMWLMVERMFGCVTPWRRQA
jgi:hypothetical protein